MTSRRVAAIVVTAISFHFLLALPDGHLRDTARRTRPSAATWSRWPSGSRSSRTTGPSPSPTAPSAGRGGAARDRTDARPLRRVHRHAARANGVVRHRRDPRRPRWPSVVDRAAPAGRVARTPGRRARPAATVLVPLGLLAGESRQARARTGAGGSCRSSRCSASSSWSPPSTWWWCSASATRRRPRGQGGPGALHGGVRGGRGHLRPGASAVPRVGHAVRLRIARGARRGPADLREQADPGHPDGRAAPAAGRVAAQDDGPPERRGLHGDRRGARAYG